MGFVDDAKKMADEHDEQVDQGIEKGGDAVDSKTGGKFGDQIDKGQDLGQEKTGEGDTAE
ncbi:MAG: antitoxin [Nocardioides sp.]